MWFSSKLAQRKQKNALYVILQLTLIQHIQQYCCARWVKISTQIWARWGGNFFYIQTTDKSLKLLYNNLGPKKIDVRPPYTTPISLNLLCEAVSVITQRKFFSRCLKSVVWCSFWHSVLSWRFSLQSSFLFYYLPSMLRASHQLPPPRVMVRSLSLSFSLITWSVSRLSVTKS